MNSLHNDIMPLYFLYPISIFEKLVLNFILIVSYFFKKQAFPLVFILKTLLFLKSVKFEINHITNKNGFKV